MRRRARGRIRRGAALAFLGFLVPSCEEPGGPSDLSASGARQRARLADDFMVNYGPWSQEAIDLARQYDVVVVHPSQGGLDRDRIAEIRQGVDPNDPADNVLVLAYISVGEDLRTASVDDAQMAVDPRFVGNGTGPRVDPRGPTPNGGDLEGIDPFGAPSPGGAGYASWYLDDNDGDGKPDRNAKFGGCFVNAGDAFWFLVLDAMTIDGPDGLAGFREILTRDYGRGLGCDGVFLDTFDTAAPNHFTNPSSPVRSEFEWTAPGYARLLARIRGLYPDAVVLQNRGLFFFDSRHPHYRFRTRDEVDLVLFESFRLNSDPADGINPQFYADNRFNVAPKLMAEAGRGRGFRVVSLGYAEGPPGEMDPGALIGHSSLGFEHLQEDIRATELAHGFRHYLTDGRVTLVNDFVRQNAWRVDEGPPAWSSTWNPRSEKTPPRAADPRYGIQEAVPGRGSVVVRWDVALDLNPVTYTLYYQDTPFDFDADPDLTRAVRVELKPRVGAGYEFGPGPDRYPFEDVVGDLAPGRTLYLIIRASDRSAAAHEEKNRVVLSATPF
jgi:hypothetical protein